jgi:hypothetical protein
MELDTHNKNTRQQPHYHVTPNPLHSISHQERGGIDVVEVFIMAVLMPKDGMK